MKILQVNCVYNTGSTGKIMYDVHTELLNKGYESIICYGRGSETTDKGVYKTCSEVYAKFNNLLSRFTGIMYGGCFFSTNKLIKIIKKEKPDIVHLHCINGYFVNIYRIINWLKNNNIKTVVTLHAEFMHTANCGHAFDCEKWKSGCGGCPVLREETKSLLFDGTARSFKKMKKAFEGFNSNLIVTSVSPWLMKRAMESPILCDKKHVVVLNGLDTSEFYYRKNNNIRDEYLLKNKKMVLYVTPSFSLDKNHNKGGWYVIKLAKMIRDVNVVIIGNKDSYPDLPENIINVGRVESKAKLAEFYSVADLTLIPSKRETFSMIAAESLCCGTPVVGFKAGGPETIAIDEFCRFVDYGNVELLKSSLEEFLNKTFSKENIEKISKEKYDKSVMFDNYLEVYKDLVRE